jgi:integrase
MSTAVYDPTKRRGRVDGDKYPGLWWRRRATDVVWELKLSQNNVDTSGTICYPKTQTPVKTEKEAITAWKKATANRDEGGTPLAGGTATLDEIAAKFFADLEAKVQREDRADNTIRSYRNSYRNYLEPYFRGSRKINTITDRMIARYIAAMSERTSRYGTPMTNWTVMGSLTPLRKMIKLALKEGVIFVDPFDGLDRDDVVPTERSEKGEPRILRPDELRKLIEACPENYRLPLTVLCFSGCRISELCGLTWGDVSLVERRITISKQRAATGVTDKTRAKVKSKASKRTMSMFDAAHAALEEQYRLFVAEHDRQPEDDEFVFATASGKPIDPVNFRPRGVQRAGINAGLGHIVPHDLRHSVASLMAQADPPVPVTVAARWMGHTVATFVKEYAHSYGDAQEDEALLASMATVGFGSLA